MCSSAALAFGGCTVGPDYESPTPPLPESWVAGLAAGVNAGPASVERYWEPLGDPILNQILDAAGDSLEVKQAWARLAQADAAVRVQGSRRWPIVTGNGAGSVGAAYANPDGLPNARSTFSTLGAGLNAAYEVDLFGHVTRSIEAATANAERAFELTDALLLAIRAELIFAYVDLRALQQREVTMKGHIVKQQATVTFMQEQGAWEGEAALARRSLAETEAALIPIIYRQRILKNRIAVLSGKLPGYFDELLDAIGDVGAAPASLAVGLPADVIRRRPDVRAAERRVAAECARIGVEKAELFPRFAINGTLGASAFHSDSDTTARSAGIGPAFRWNLFNAGQIRSLIDAQDARFQEALLAYEQTVLRALEQVENGITTYVGEHERLQVTIRAAAGAEIAAQEFRKRYRSEGRPGRGFVQGERENRILDDLVIVGQARVAGAYVALCRDLGGGYEPWREPQADGEAP